MAFDSSRIPEDLLDAYQERRCALFLGAGASKRAGLPLWGELLDRLVGTAEANALVEPEEALMYRSLLKRPEKYLMVAAAVKKRLGPKFDASMERILRHAAVPTDWHEALLRLNRLQFLVTTNYDTLIEDAFRKAGIPLDVSSFRDAGDMHRRLLRRDFFLLKAHGDLSRIGSGIILTDVDYRDVLYRSPGYRSILSIIFQMYSVVFIGASMSDPEINLLLGYVADAFSSGAGPVHYAVMAKESITKAERERWYEDFKVQIVEVSSSADYEDVTQFLNALAAT